ncbi:Cytochrome P450 4g15 [Harpegnathos saltator]|uniref:Cytochrome P450 4g15 n=1 Tax=Harpegnathos saltator TaxID=610380 RepID=E2BFW6_HARSA|nr:Cytochrome P450 4g15 [Harpegnathos saltator]
MAYIFLALLVTTYGIVFLYREQTCDSPCDEITKFSEPWLGGGLLITKGNKWRKHRKVIAPTFHMSILKTFVPLIYENSLDLARRLREKVGQQFDCHDYLSAITVDIMMETAMGIRREKKQNTGHDYAMAIMKSCVGRKYAMLKLKILLSTILRNYRITSDVSYQDFALQGDIILKRSDGFNIKIESRKSTSDKGVTLIAQKREEV